MFHLNYLTRVRIASPHYKDGAPHHDYELIVMNNKDDDSWSFAIDEFPVMAEEAIEAFWVEKVMQHKVQREEFFQELEAEARGAAGTGKGSADTAQSSMEEVEVRIGG